MTFSRLLRSWPVAVIGLLLGLAIAIRRGIRVWERRLAFYDPKTADELGLIDFRDTAILPNLAIASGVNPYDASAYTAFFPFAQEFDPYIPWWITATHPLSLLTWDTSTAIYVTICTILAFLAATYLLTRIRTTDLGKEVPLLTLAAICLLATLVWRGTPLAMGPGNIGGIVALAAGLALLAPSTVTTALLLAVAWIKPQFGIPITVILLCLPGRAKGALVGTAVAAVASIPAIVATSQLAGGFLGLIESVLRTTGEVAAGKHVTDLDTRIDLFGKLSFALPDLSLAITFPLGLAIVAGVTLWSRRLIKVGQLPMALVIVSTTVLLFIPHFRYDIDALLPPIALAVATLIPHWSEKSNRILLTGIALVSIVFVLPGGAIHAASETPYTVTLVVLLGLCIGWAVVQLRKSTRVYSPVEAS